MNNCEYLGCMYNEDGRCKYLDANIKVPAARACNKDDIQADFEAYADSLGY